jgi:hypothetical protein
MLWAEYDQSMIYPNQSEIDRNNGRYPELSDAVSYLASNQTPLLINGHYPYVFRDVLPAETKVITVLRDPIDRSISMMRRARRRVPRFVDLSLMQLLDDKGFRESSIANYQTKIFSIASPEETLGVNHPLQMQPWRLEAALENLSSCAVVGWTDEMDAVGGQLATEGIQVGETRRTNITPSHDTDPIGADVIDRLNEIVSLDIMPVNRIRGGIS